MAARLLNCLRRQGVPCLTTTAPWTLAQKDEAVARGPHVSCLEQEQFIFEEMQAVTSKGQWMILPYEAVRHL